ncbi:MAG: TlpA family protein disulfide reductase [Treponema sp.]|jgi:thiol-disulfide isomerase/thioredoxin|nr:TlpA family protein disulfide reductase [Treponema sp.]
MKKIVVLAGLFMGICFVASAAPPDIPSTVSSAFERAGFPLLKQRQAPVDFTLRVLNGGTVQLSRLKGTVVFLNFWATWCPPCRSEMPSMQVLYDRFRDRGLQFAAVDIMEEGSDIAEFLGYFRLTFPVLLDTDGTVSDNYGINAIPTTFIIDRDGSIIAQAVGSRKWDTPDMMKAFEALLTANYGR